MICNRDTSGADKEECSCELHGIRGGAKSLELHPVPLPFGQKNQYKEAQIQVSKFGSLLKWLLLTRAEKLKISS